MVEQLWPVVVVALLLMGLSLCCSRVVEVVVRLVVVLEGCFQSCGFLWRSIKSRALVVLVDVVVVGVEGETERRNCVLTFGPFQGLLSSSL